MRMSSCRSHNRKRRRPPSPDSFTSTGAGFADSDILFGLLLAAISKVQSDPRHTCLIKKCLRKLRRGLLPDSEFLPVPILSLLPSIIKSRCWNVACLGLEVVGVVAIMSLEMNEQIVSDGEILNGVLWSLRSPSRKVKAAACSCVLDLSSSSVGRERVLAFSALETLMHCLLQVPKSLWLSVTLCPGDGKGANGHLISCKDEEFLTILLDAIIILVNSCNHEQLNNISVQSLESFVLLKGLWADLNNQILAGSVLDSNHTGDYYSTNSTVSHLGESIFRLSIGAQCANSVPSAVIMGRIFGSDVVSFENFVLKHWERSPGLINKTQKMITKEDALWSLLWPLNLDSSIPKFVSSMLRNMVTCPLIASDELNILNFLKQERDELATQIIYRQDIRVLKMDRHLNKETHFFSEGDSCNHKPFIFSLGDFEKCEEALGKGYSVAIRGMEFRLESVAAITEELASLFGQPSVGANLYITPPNSQGLALHYDDHCVFVCQLVGTKRWTILPPDDNLLPRLYEPIHGKRFSENCDKGNMELLVKEGDILYIPRGYFHEAHTSDDGFSLHLTLAIEIEAPFEWEGFMHAALECWSWKTLKRNEHPQTQSPYLISVNLLHIMIGILGNSDPTFRKACLIGSTCLSNVADWLDTNLRTTFIHLIETISHKSQFSEVLTALEMTVHRNEDPFRRLGWLQILHQEGKPEGCGCEMFDITAKELLSLCGEDTETMEAVFMNLKSWFCKEMTFEQGISEYKFVLEKYKKVRKQYMNGMLALHCRLSPSSP